MARTMAGVLICLAGMLTLVVGMPQARTRNSGPGVRPGQNSSGLGLGAESGDGGPGPQSKAFACPGCSAMFDSRRALDSHRGRYTALLARFRMTSPGQVYLREGCAGDDRPPIVSTWQATGQRAGGRVQNVGGAGARPKGTKGDEYHSTDSEDLEPQPDSDAAGGAARSRSRSPRSDHRPSTPHSPGPAAAAVPAPWAAAPPAVPALPVPARSRPEVRT